MHQNDLKTQKIYQFETKKNKNFLNFFKNIFETQKQTDQRLLILFLFL